MGGTTKSIHARAVIVALMWLVLVFPVLAAQPSAEQRPSEAILSTMHQLQHVLSAHSADAAGKYDERRHELDAILRARVGYEDMAKRALGAQWGSLEPAQQQEFVGLFVSLLRDTFANHVADLVDEQIVVLAEHQYDETFAEVHTRLTGPKVDTPVDFRVVKKDASWLVYDVVVDGASLVHNYRAQMARVMREGTYRGLVEQLKARAVMVKRFESPRPN